MEVIPAVISPIEVLVVGKLFHIVINFSNFVIIINFIDVMYMYVVIEAADVFIPHSEGINNNNMRVENEVDG